MPFVKLLNEYRSAYSKLQDRGYRAKYYRCHETVGKYLSRTCTVYATYPGKMYEDMLHDMADGPNSIYTKAIIGNSGVWREVTLVVPIDLFTKEVKDWRRIPWENLRDTVYISC